MDMIPIFFPYLVGRFPFIPPDDYHFYSKFHQLNSLKVYYMRALKCGVFQLLTVVNDWMSFERQHLNSFTVSAYIPPF